MVDTTQTNTTVPVETTPVSVAPVIAPQSPTEAPTAVSPIAPTPTPVAVETPLVAPVEAVVAPEAPKPASTALGEALDAAPLPEAPKAPATEIPKAEEGVKPPVEGEPKTEGQSEEPAPLPVYEAFKVPEGVTLDNERVKNFTGILADLETKSKADHALVQEFGQKAVDFHVSELQKTVEDYTQSLQTYWEKQKTDWKDAFLKDPEIGGNRFQTTVDSARTFIRTHGGTADQQTEFRNLMETSGLGNHPAMIRLLANAGQTMSEGRPLAATKPVQQVRSKTQTLYGKSE